MVSANGTTFSLVGIPAGSRIAAESDYDNTPNDRGLDDMEIFAQEEGLAGLGSL